MLYLAKVSLARETGEVALQLLARQKSEHHWVLSTNRHSIAVPNEKCPYGDGVLVLAQLTSERHVESVDNATDWVLSIIEKYLLTGIAPDILHQEAERAEEWRKDLTLKTQDLARRALELETRRDQIQELEKKLESERQQLEAMRLKVGQEDAQSEASDNPEAEYPNPTATQSPQEQSEVTHPSEL